MKKSIILVSVAVIVIAIFWIGLLSHKPDKVRIAFNLPLSGPIAAFMGEYTDAVKDGVYDECSLLGVDTDKFEFDIQDNAWDVPRAISIYQKQSLKPIDVYISGTSPQSIAITPLTEEAKTPHFLIAFDATLTETGHNLFRILPNYRVINPGFEDYINERDAKTIFCVQMNISSHEEQYNLLEQKFIGSNKKFIRERIDGSFQDYRTLVKKIKDTNPDLILVSLYSYQMSPLIDAMKTESVIKNHNTLFIPDFIDLIHEGVDPKKLSGILFSCPLFELSDVNDAVKKWKSNWAQKHKKTPGYIEAYGYDTGRVIARASRLGKPTTMRLLEQFPYDGISGEIVLDENRDMVSTLTLAEVLNDGSVVSFPTSEKAE
ncbi:ABC transporter substrate-binding protein [bacterium]|nr:ABC transporter substrate-binding protein [bacterium]